ncbi:F-box only protein 28-like [Oppia nitens]|uniref:F-box only protein 28-like n=1 Tax=Oppia nitens TaxID=1686743 RepID=UPI0023DC1600|nr:F-box only protein 28-like [Oppia nitens]
MAAKTRVDNVCDLPVELLDIIMTYLSYDETAKLRLVCRLFDSCSQRLLNRGFSKVEKYHAICFKRVKQQLPRRESERRSHPLARHCEVLSAIETRLSLLGMTFMKYVEMSLCCFIPGKVIDEIYRVLRVIQTNPNPPRVHELMQELRDISSMAMEYFEEKIAPTLKTKLSASSGMMSSVASLSASAIGSSHRSLPTTSSTPSVAMTRIGSFSDTEINKSNANNALFLQIQTSQNTIKRELNDIKVKLKELSNVKRDITTIRNKVKDSEKLFFEKDQTIAELKAELEDLKRRMNENEKKNAINSNNEQPIHKETKPDKRKINISPKITNKRIRKQLTTDVKVKEEVQTSLVIESPVKQTTKLKNKKSTKRPTPKQNKISNKKKVSVKSTAKSSPKQIKLKSRSSKVTQNKNKSKK